MAKKEKLTLEQHNSGSHSTYKIVDMVNRADFQVGQYLKQAQVDNLLVEPNLTVIVKGVKR